MRYKTLKTVAGVFLAATLSTACGSTKANPCLVWTADNLNNLAKLTVQPGATGCTANQTADRYEDFFLQEYPVNNTLAIYPFTMFAGLTSNGNRAVADPAHDPIASGNWDNNGLVNDNTECTVPTMTTSEQDFTSMGGSLLKYEFSNLTFYQASFAQGTDWSGTVKITDGSCVATFNVQAIAPEVVCATDDDCAPLPDLAAGKALGSGIAPQYHTFCDTSAAGQAEAGDPSLGVCFFAEAYPSLCPADQLEGAAGSSCQLGKK